MEVVVGTAGNIIFLDWLDYIQKQILEKSYTAPTSFWHNARMRYVFHTTGPYSMNRFLKLPDISKRIKNMKTLECNHFKETKTMTAKQKRFFDVISYQSQSYFTDEHEIRVQVGAGTKQLPPIPTSKRMRTKSCVRLMGPAESSMLAPNQNLATIEAPSQEPRNHRSVTSSGSGVAADASGTAGSSTSGAMHAASAVHRDELPVYRAIYSAKAGSVDSISLMPVVNGEDHTRILQLRGFFYAHRMSVSAKVLLEDMPDELRSWILSPQKRD